MKQFLTSTVFMTIIFPAFCQAPITIDSADVPVPNGIYNYENIGPAAPPIPTGAENQNWNYTPFQTLNTSTAEFSVETDSFFLANSIDLSVRVVKALNQNFGYSIDQKFDFDASGVHDRGAYVLNQGFSISPFTGNAADSIKLYEQKIIFDDPVTIRKFPTTFNTSWTSTGRRSIDFEFTVTSAGIIKETVTQVYRSFRRDTIFGWGTLRINTASGSPSIPYEVLLQRETSYNVDSFYMGGMPADSALLAGFGIVQGQRTAVTNRIHFYRKGSFVYMMRFNFLSDSTFSNYTNVFINQDNLIADAVGVQAADGATFSTLLYPNPCVGESLHLQVMGKEVTAANYAITDLLGRTVQVGNVQFSGMGLATVQLNPDLQNGSYFISYTDNGGVRFASEKFTLTR